MKKLLMLLACSYCFALNATAQGTLKGKLSDSTSNAPIGLAPVTVFRAADTSIITYRLSSPDGEFKVPGLPFHLNCRVVISVSGYSAFRKEFTLSNSESTIDMGIIQLSRSAKSLDEVIVLSERPPVIIRKDTVEFNASAFKTLPNALVEDLLKKLPGVQVDNEGNIMVNGKPVNKITVDGKSFFGDDPKMATRNLPANVIDKIQVTDDKEEMIRNGDDNINNVGKVVNITLKKGVKKGWFGKMYAGGGTGDLFEAGGIANIYRDTLQVSTLAYVNNLNKPGFSYGELMQAGGLERSRSNSNNNSTSVWRNPNGSGVSINGVNFGGMQNYGGITTSKGFGINLNHTPNTKKSFFLQYFRGNINVNRTNVTDVRQFNGDTVVTNNTTLGGPIETNAHNIGLGARLKPDSVTNILVNANYSIGLQDEQRISDVYSNSNILGALSEGNVFQHNPAKNNYYRHTINISRLSKKKKGRRFNFNQALDISKRFNDYSTESWLHYLYPNAYDSNYAQLRLERIPRTDASLSFNYSEPLSKLMTIRMGGRYEYSQLDNTVNTYNKDAVTDKFEIPNESLSSRFRRTGNRFIATPGLEFKWKNLTLTPGVRILMQSFDNKLASMPEAVLQKRNDLLPSLNIVYKKINFNYNKDIVMPGYMSLIPVTDNTNPYLITKGNTSLLPMERNNLSLNYNYNDTKRHMNIGIYSNGSFTNNDVVQSINVDAQGVQTTMPVNANGSRNFYLNFNIYKQYKNKQKFIFTWNTGGNFNYNRNRLFYNDVASLQNTFNFNNWVGIRMNFNDKIELNSTISKGYNFTNYSSSNFRKVNIEYTWVDNEVVIRWPKHVIWETTLNYDYNSNMPPGTSKGVVRWNAAVNYTMLKSEALVLKLYVFDLLKTNRNLYSYVNRNMITVNQTNTLAQYGLATLTYNVRPYGSAKKKEGGRERLFLF